jgi:hypothetical protein
MPNPYTTTITFPEETLSSGDTWQLVLTFSTALSDSNVAVNSDDTGVKIVILNHGKCIWDYDFENRFLVPGSTQIKLADTEDYIHDLIFLYTAVSEATDRQFKVDILLNGSNEFNGYALEDSISYEMDTKVFEFTAAPKMDILKNTPIYDEDDNPENPIGYADLNAEILITEIITDIYEQVFPGITGTYNHDWEFKDENDVEGYAITDLYMRPNSMYNHSQILLNDLGEILKNYCDTFVAKTGILNADSYFFEKVGFYSTSNTQTIDLINHFKYYKYAKIQYSRLNILFDGGFARRTYGNFTNLDSAKIEKDIIPYGSEDGFGNFEGNIYADSGGVTGIQYTKDPIIYNVFIDSFTVAHHVFVDWRNDLKNLLVHRFTCKGIDYVMTKTIVYDSGYYQINSMTKDWEKEETVIEAFYCGAVT